MNFAKISGAAFMLFILISAPFFAIQTTQDGINRTLAEEFQYKEGILGISDTVTYLVEDGELKGNYLEYEITNQSQVGSTVTNQGIDYYEIINNHFSYESLITWNLPDNKDIDIYIEIEGFGPNNRFFILDYTYVTHQDENDNSLLVKVFAFTTETINVSFSGIDILTLGITNYNGSLTQTANLKIYNIYYVDAGTPSVPSYDYYQIMENARLADYQNVDSFTNIFYTIPYMATSFAEAYNRFINFTDNLNPFKVKDESTGEFRDQTPSEVMDSWPARIIVWFRRFTD